MKRLLILGACIVLCSSHVARAAILPLMDTADNTLLGTVLVTRTTGDGTGVGVNGFPTTVDKLVITVESFAGHAVGGTGPTLEGITGMGKGVWTPVIAGTTTPVSGGLYVARGSSTSDLSNKWANRTSSAANFDPYYDIDVEAWVYPPEKWTSWVNFPTGVSILSQIF